MNAVNSLPFLIVLASFLISIQPLNSQSITRFTREAMLREISHNVFLAGYADLHSKLIKLNVSLETLTREPSTNSLQQSRDAWLGVSLAANLVRCFQSGPIKDRDYLASFYYWQVLPGRIEAVIQSDRPIDKTLLEELGSTSKGLFALEYMLFDRSPNDPENSQKSTTLELLRGPSGARRAAYMLALGRDLETKAADLVHDWSLSTPDAASTKLAQGGQESINLLVNQLAMALEDVVEHLHFILQLPPPVSAQLERIERTRSGSSLAGLIASFEGLKKMYRGGDGLGPDDALKQINPVLEKRVQEHIEAAAHSIRALASPLEKAVIDNRAAVEKAYESSRALEIVIKVDIVSALGVTLTFSSNDGD
jgi:predicted lipoprotein